MSQRRQTPEKEYQKTIEEALLLRGYAGTHIFPLMDSQGIYRTPTTSPGWPDLVYLRPPRILAIEVKDDGKKPPEHQRAWLTLFSMIPCARAWVAAPSDPPWPILEQWIKRPAEAPAAYGFEPVEDPVAVIQSYNVRQRKRKAEARARKAAKVLQGRSPSRRG